MSILKIELPTPNRKNIFIWRVRDDSDRMGRRFLAVGECATPEEAAYTAKRVQAACQQIFKELSK